MALIVSKLAIVATLTLAVKMMANATNFTSTGDDLSDGVGALGVLFAGVICFAVASITPMVLYKLMPTVEGAVIGAGVAGGWGRGAMTGMYAASTAKNLGGSLGKLASGPVPSDSGDGGSGGEPGGGGSSPAGSPAASSTLGSAEASSASSSAGLTGGSASGASGAAGGGAGAAAGAVAAPVMVATAGVDAAKSGLTKLTDTADATIDAAASRHPSSYSRPDDRSGSAPESSPDAATPERSPSTTKVSPASDGGS